jgi:hypothetical protein
VVPNALAVQRDLPKGAGGLADGADELRDVAGQRGGVLCVDQLQLILARL